MIVTGDGSVSTKQKRSRDRTLIGFIIVIGFIAFCFTLVLYPAVATQMDKVILGAILGTLGNNAVTVVSFYFGSSSGSTDKDEANAATSEKLATVAAEVSIGKVEPKVEPKPDEHPSGLSGEHDVVLDAIHQECLHGN